MSPPEDSTDGSNSSLGSLFSSGVIYAIAAIAQKGLQFFLLPVYGYYLTEAQWGVWASMTLFSNFLFGTLAIGLPSAIMKCYHRDCESDEERSALLGTALTIAVPFLIVGILLAWLLAPRISAFLLQGDPQYAAFVRLAASTGFFSGILALLFARLRAEEKAVLYCIGTLSQFALALTLNLVFVVGAGLGVRGILLGNLLSNAAVVPLGLWLVRQSSRFTIRRRLAVPLLAFGVQLVPTFFAQFAIDQSNVWFVTNFETLARGGIYDVGYKIGRIMELCIVWPFQLAWPAFAYGISKQAGHRLTYANTLSYLLAAMSFVGLGLTLVSRLGLEVLLPKGDFATANAIVPLIVLAYGLNGIPYCVGPAIHIHGKTRYLSYLTALAAASHLLLCTILVPQFGIVGAASVTVTSYLFIAVGTVICAERLHGVSYQYLRIAKALIPVFALFGLATRLPGELTLLNALAHAGVILAYPVALLTLRFFDAQELETLRGVARTGPRKVLLKLRPAR
ncbi:MAG: oligosaccharide flippase family protein [Acidobacteriota bacterium]